MSDKCIFCLAKDVETRMGCCFDCATRGEDRAARRTVVQHIGKGLLNVARGRWGNARFDFRWSWERLTRTGDYAPNGYFDRQVPDWKRPAQEVRHD